MPFDLHRAARDGDIALVQELLQKDTDINSKDNAGYTPLMYALQSPAASVELVQCLLDRGGIVSDSLEGLPCNVVSCCLRGGDPRKLELLIERGEDLHYTRGSEYTAIHDAVFSLAKDSHLQELLQILIAHSVDLNVISSYNESALRVLSRLGQFDAVRLLLDVGADESQLAWTPLHRAIALGTLDDVRTVVEKGAPLEALDYWERTPWLIAVKTGDLSKAQYLAASGASTAATARGNHSPLSLAIESRHTPMLRWLIQFGISVDPPSDCRTPLMTAVDENHLEAVDILIAAGADVNRETACGSTLRRVHTRDIALRLLDAGAAPANLSFEGRRAILGLRPEASELLFNATPEDYRAAPTTRWGRTNPEHLNQPFWQAMIRSGISAYAARQLNNGTHDDCPVWCAQRFGQSLTRLPDGRIVQIGGEHEDFYHSDFCIYNDVFVHHRDGRIDIYCYPEDVFPPTDFHTATLVGDSIYVIGGLGYSGSRRFGETPVYRLDTNTLAIHRIATAGDPPGWISRHRARLIGPNEIRISGGKLCAQDGDNETYEDNPHVHIFDTKREKWRRE